MYTATEGAVEVLNTLVRRPVRSSFTRLSTLQYLGIDSAHVWSSTASHELIKRFLIALVHRMRPAGWDRRLTSSDRGGTRVRACGVVRAKHRGQERRLAPREPRAPRSRVQS